MYDQYRPKYPKQLVDFIVDKYRIKKDFIFADFGACTGLLTELIIDAGYTAYAIEPDKKMLEIAEEKFYNKGSFIPLCSNADNTLNLDHTINIITCAQSFHWFESIKNI